MADLTDIQAAQSVKIVGVNSTGVETNPVNADVNGNLQVVPTNAGPVTPGTVAGSSGLAGGQFNTTLPTLAPGQQSALQLDSSGRLLIAAVLVDGYPPLANITVQDTATVTTAVANGQSSFSGTPTAGSAVSFVLTAIETVIIEVTGTWTGTVQLEVSADNGVTWSIRPAHQAGNSASGSFGSFTANFTAGCNTAGYTNFRVRAITAWTGTATIRVNESINTNSVYVANAIRITDANNDIAKVTSTGNLQVTNAPVDGEKASYRAASAASFLSAALSTDIFTITGSATKTVRITRLMITGVQSTPSSVSFFFIKRSAADTGGTSATLTAVPSDSSSSAATATVRQYTVNPTALGAAVGTIMSFKKVVQIAAVAGNVSSDVPTEFYFGNNPAQAIVLRGTSEVLAINLGGVTVTGGSWLCTVEWTEE